MLRTFVLSCIWNLEYKMEKKTSDLDLGLKMLASCWDDRYAKWNPSTTT